MTQLPWPAAGVKSWKNQEQPREFEVTDELFAAVYAQGDRVLRDAMDVATATGMRVTDVRTARLPINGFLRFKAAKTKKWAEFSVEQSPVLKDLVGRRLAMKVDCTMLLTTDTGRQVTASMLRQRWEYAREKAALAASDVELAAAIRAMYLRDMRKRAADLSDDVHSASQLLQHSSIKLTETHYRTKATRLNAVR
ncbi:MAG: integrase [Rhodoferax sp.]|nr:integrase [Rhodoferax sp.]